MWIARDDVEEDLDRPVLTERRLERQTLGRRDRHPAGALLEGTGELPLRQPTLLELRGRVADARSDELARTWVTSSNARPGANSAATAGFV